MPTELLTLDRVERVITQLTRVRDVATIMRGLRQQMTHLEPQVRTGISVSDCTAAHTAGRSVLYNPPGPMWLPPEDAYYELGEEHNGVEPRKLAEHCLCEGALIGLIAANPGLKDLVCIVGGFKFDVVRLLSL